MTASAGLYSPHKVLQHPDRLAALRAGEAVAPVHVQLIPTNRCPHRCNFCAYRQEGYCSNETFDARDEIPAEKLAEIVDDCQAMGVRAIELTGGGEPTAHHAFLTLCRQILAAGIELGLVTNGSRWSPEHSEVLRKAQWVRFSLDAGCAATYERTRGVGPREWWAVRNAIRSLAESRAKDDPVVIGAGFVITKDNYREVPLAAEIVKALGADNIRLSAVFQGEGASYFDAFGEEAELFAADAEDFADERFTVYNLFKDRYRDLQDGRPQYDRCGYQHLVTYLGADQNVYRCCVVAYNHVGLLGSIRNRSFRDLWQSDELQEKLRSFDPRQCPRCMRNEANRLLGTVAGPPVKHANFI